MVAGGVIATAAFVISGLVQIQVNKTLPDLPNAGHSYISITNALPNEYNCSINATTPQDNGRSPFVVPVNGVI